MDIKIDVDGLDDLVRKMKDPEFLAKLTEEIANKDFDKVLWRAKNLCTDPQLIEQMGYKIARDGNKLHYSLFPDEAIECFEEAHRFLKGDLSNVSNDALMRLFSNHK